MNASLHAATDPVGNAVRENATALAGPGTISNVPDSANQLTLFDCCPDSSGISLA
jgi:hypothetical protein